MYGQRLETEGATKIAACQGGASKRISGIPLLVIGGTGVLFFVTFDFFRLGTPGFGMKQLAGFVVSAVIAFAGLRKIALSKGRFWDGLLVLIYLGGMLFMGLNPRAREFQGSNELLDVTFFCQSDFIINILGFAPLGYLMMSYLSSEGRIRINTAAAALVATSGLGISLFIEIMQYYFITGRSSSLYDLLANGLGAIGGIGYYLLERRLSERGYPSL